MKFILTESVRIIAESWENPFAKDFELVDCKWIPARSPLYCGDLLKGRPLSSEEIAELPEFKANKSI